MLADISKIDEKEYLAPSDPASKDYQFCRWMTKGKKKIEKSEGKMGRLGRRK